MSKLLPLAQMMAMLGIPEMPRRRPPTPIQAVRIGDRNKKCSGCGHKNKKCTCGLYAKGAKP